MSGISPQEGFQTDFISTEADICVGGASAGVGKTFALLMEAARYTNKKDYRGVIFRRTIEQVKMAGGLWDTSQELYSYIGGTSREQSKDWTFPSGAKISFNHLQYEKDKINWQGSQVAFVGFDELTHFSRGQFFYLVTRARSAGGIRTYFRATCNPDPDSWVARFIDWWIDPDTGFPIKDRIGKIRYFTMDDGKDVWADTPEELKSKVPHILENEAFQGRDLKDLVKSVTFIPGSIYDNKKMLDRSPEYLGNLLAQDEETKAQLLYGNWKVRVDDKELINYTSLRDSFTNTFVGLDDNGNIKKDLTKYISADIAMQGSDRFVVFVWHGWRVIDCYIDNKTDPRDIVNKIEELATLHHVHRSNIVYDADGLGTYLRGYLSGARPFVNGSKAIGKEQYKNLKAQCAYRFAQVVNDGSVFITPYVAGKSVTFGKDNKTIEELIGEERRALKRLKPDGDGKLSIIPKEQMKNIVGRSPDVIEALMYRAYFEVIKNNKIINYGISS